jgi:hypothetical protein
VFLNDLRGHIKPNPRAACFLFCGEIELKNIVDNIGGDAACIVLNLDNRFGVAFGGSYRNKTLMDAVFVERLYGVFDKVDKKMDKLVFRPRDFYFLSTSIRSVTFCLISSSLRITFTLSSALWIVK